jgi:ribosomal protein L32E
MDANDKMHKEALKDAWTKGRGNPSCVGKLRSLSGETVYVEPDYGETAADAMIRVLIESGFHRAMLTVMVSLELIDWQDTGGPYESPSDERSSRGS